MKRTAAALIISLLLAAVSPVRALELETGMIRPFADNVLTVTSEEGGTIEIPWTALTFGGEPLSPGSVTLQATLKGYDRTVEAAEIRQKVGTPMPAVLCCLPAARDFYPDGKHVLKIEIAVSGRGTYEMDIALLKPDNVYAFEQGVKWADAHPNWISVDDAYPEENEVVIAYDDRQGTLFTKRQTIIERNLYTKSTKKR